MAGYLGTKAVLLSTTAADVIGNAEIGGNLTVGGNFTSTGIDDNASSTAITIDSSQNVGIGTSSPTAKLEVSSASNPEISIASTSGATSNFLNFKAISHTQQVQTQLKTVDNGDFTSDLAFLFKATGTGGALSEKVRIDSSGNVGIGTSSPQRELHLASSQVDIRLEDNSGTSNYGEITYTDGRMILSADKGDAVNTSTMEFQVDNIEAMRIDAAGKLLVGTTTALSSERFGVDSSTEAAQFRNSASGNGTVSAKATHPSYADWVYTATTDRAGGTSCGFFRGIANSSINIYIYNNGNIVNANNSYGAISDVKLKENVTDATPKLEQLNQVRVVNYNLIGQEQKQIGVIAQELEQVFPNMVEETVDRDEDGNDLGTTTKSVKYSVFVPMLIKAMQEQQAKIDDLETRITALEGN